MRYAKERNSLFIVTSIHIRSVMSQKTGSKKILLHPIENHREAANHPSKNTLASHVPSQTDAAVNTEQFSLNRDTGTNTPNYAEQIVNAMQNGSNAAEEIAQMLMEGICHTSMLIGPAIAYCSRASHSRK